MFEHNRLTKQLFSHFELPSARAPAYSLTPLCLALTCFSAAAQHAATGENMTLLEEVVVTAQFREQNLQDTPIAITALTALAMEARGQSDVIDIAQSAPNVTIQPSPSNFGNSIAASIRGIGQYDSTLSFEPGVGIYIDDVYHPTLFGSVFDLLDLERAEVLRGPQGTLAGKNAIGGAIKLYSRKPSGEGSFAEFTYGASDRQDFRGAADLTLIPDEMFLRISAVSKKRSGYLDRLDYACATGNGSSLTFDVDCKIGTEGAQKYQGIRAALAWQPNDRLAIHLTADSSEDDSEPQPSRLLYSQTTDIYLTDQEFVNYSTYADPAKGYSIPVISDAQGKGGSANIQYDFSDHASLTSITAYRHNESQFSTDADTSPEHIQLQYLTFDYSYFTQELRFNGRLFDEFIDYTVGGFYFKSDADDSGRVNLGPALFDFLPDNKNESRSYSGFIHSVIHATDKLDLSLGARYTNEKKSLEYGRYTPENPTQIHPHPLVGPLHGSGGEYKGNRWDYRFNTAYRITDNVMIYGTASTGYKGGGVNPRPFTPAQVEAFGPETLDAYELGLKADVFDGRLRINTAMFFNKYEDIQLTITNGYAGFPASAIPLNAGSADVKGLELEVNMAPVDGLLIDFVAGYLDFEYTDLSAAALASGVDNTMVNPFTPELQMNLGGQYEIPLAGGATLTPRLDVNHQDSFFTNAVNNPLNNTPSYTVANARLTWLNAAKDLQVALSITNLTDKYHYLNVFYTTTANTSIGAPARPREWAVTVKKDF